MAGIAAAAILLLAVMLAERRRAAVVMQRERGAGALQLVLPALAEALLISVPLALAGWLLATRLFPAAAGDLPFRMALAVQALPPRPASPWSLRSRPATCAPSSGPGSRPHIRPRGGW